MTENLIILAFTNKKFPLYTTVFVFRFSGYAYEVWITKMLKKVLEIPASLRA